MNLAQNLKISLIKMMPFYETKRYIHSTAAEEIISLSKAANLSNQKLAQFRDEFIPL